MGRARTRPTVSCALCSASASQSVRLRLYSLCLRFAAGENDIAQVVESLGLSRHPSKDYERLPKTSEPTIYVPMSLIMLGRLVGRREAFCPRQPQLTVCRTRSNSKAVGAGCGLSVVY